MRGVTACADRAVHGVQFPAGTQVIRSAADPGGQGGYGVQSISAVLRLPRGSAVPALADAAPASADDEARTALRREGPSRISGVTSDRTKLFAGTAAGSTLVSVWSAYGQL